MLQLTTCRAVFHLCSVFEAEGEEQVSINGHDGTKDHWVVTEEIAHFCWSEKFTTPLYLLYCTTTIDLSANPENFHNFFTNAMYLPVEFTAFLTFLSCWKHVKSSLLSNNFFFFFLKTKANVLSITFSRTKQLLKVIQMACVKSHQQVSQISTGL